MQSAEFRSESDRQNAEELLAVVAVMENWRGAFLSGDFHETMDRLLEVLAQTDEECAAEAALIGGWMVAAAPVMRQVGREAAFWIDLMLEDVPAPAPQPPEGRVIDVQGWLELLYEPGRHLVLCGMNEGKVPARNTGDPWLGEAAGAQLGLLGNTDRAARDAFLYQAMLEARRSGGRVDVFCAKSGTGGEALLPSRLLLAAGRDDLPQRVKFLFQGVEPPEAGMRWHADWKWQPRRVEELRRLSVTSFSTWLACPFRFYLKHALRMQTPEPDRVEWNARDFGNIAHGILERWGRDTTARDLTDSGALGDWLSTALDQLVGEWFGNQPPLSVRLQTESLRQRLAWFARVQSAIRADGWQTIELEQPFTLEIGATLIRGTYDRLDRHCETGALRVIDYKTGKVDAVDKEHRSKISASTVLPAHIPEDCPVIHTVDGTQYRWKNLQLPLYALALKQSHGALPIPCYFHFGATEANVKLDEWADFPEQDPTAAGACAEWITGQIAAGVFWPPAEKVAYDDFAILTAGRALAEMCDAPA
jgi:ATP-dependent helicase/nuclease subunit B